jgi:2-keto-4-pentenoate hydratase/2-oxohepta-3-ene-1,7-dioic acid hydratase in catechol pathway
MKFVRFNGGRTGLAVADATKIIDVGASLDKVDANIAEAITAVLPGDGTGSWTAMIEAWEDLRPGFRALERLYETAPDRLALIKWTDAQLNAPLPSLERRIFALGANTVEHIRSVTAKLPGPGISVEDIYQPKRNGAAPVGFNVVADSVVGPNAIITPPEFVKKLDYEAECAAIVGKTGRNMGLNTPIWGYTAWNDLGMRDGHLNLLPVSPSFGYSLNLWKNWDGANACGPWVVVDEGFDVNAVQCQLFVNGEQRQNWNTRDMIYSFAELFDHLSRYFVLKAGDIGVSGTGRGTAIEGEVDGPQWLKPQDVIEIRLDGIAPLVNTVGTWQL